MGAAAWIKAASSLLESVLGSFEGDRKRQAELLLKQADSMHAQAMAQIDVNRQEAAHDSLFVAGARPFILWVCGVAIAMDFIVRPLLAWLAFWLPDMPALPSLISDNLWELMAGMLGLSGLRTFEKTKRAGG